MERNFAHAQRGAHVVNAEPSQDAVGASVSLEAVEAPGERPPSQLVYAATEALSLGRLHDQ